MAADAVVGPELHQVAVGRRRYFTGLLLGRDVQQEEARTVPYIEEELA